jgi:hypothetical protein
MRLLGYTDNLVGPWPIDYIAKAGQLDVLDDVTLVPTAAATRAKVAVMASNLMDETMVSWNKDDEEFYEKTYLEGGDAYALTLLTNSFSGATSAEITFDSDDADDLAVAAWGYTGTTKDKIQVLTSGGNKTLYKDYAISGGNTLFDLAGQNAKLIYRTDDDKTTVAYIDVKTTV